MNADHEGEFRLGFPTALSDRPDVVRREFRDSARPHLTAPNGPGLSDAGGQLIEIRLLHLFRNPPLRGSTASPSSLRLETQPMPGFPAVNEEPLNTNTIVVNSKQGYEGH
ncbi:MAG TPA: hypothetical protein VKA15_05785 [Isosphaeraceae bacterium]|nr:hypothetical protein [Isosphaeraceae bacterium]